MSQSTDDFDERGYPILLAVKAVGQVAAQTTTGASVKRNVRSGNSNVDPGSGRFAKGGIRKPKSGGVADVNPVAVNRLGVPQGVSQEEWERRLDAIRDAAREYDEMGQGDAKEFLNGRVNDLSKVDVDAFLSDVREQRIDDLIDILDHQLRSRVDGSRRARRFVRLQAPRGFVKRLFASLSDDEIIKVTTRLANRGWAVDDLIDQIISRVNKQERKEQLESRFRAALGDVVKLDDWEGRFRPDMDDVELVEMFEDEEPRAVHVEMPQLPTAPSAIELADALGKVASSLPAPVVNLSPVINVEAPKPTNKKVIRDSKGNMTGIENA